MKILTSGKGVRTHTHINTHTSPTTPTSPLWLAGGRKEKGEKEAWVGGEPEKSAMKKGRKAAREWFAV